MKAFKYKREDDYFYAVRQNDFEIKGIKNKLEDISIEEVRKFLEE